MYLISGDAYSNTQTRTYTRNIYTYCIDHYLIHNINVNGVPNIARIKIQMFNIRPIIITMQA